MRVWMCGAVDVNVDVDLGVLFGMGKFDVEVDVMDVDLDGDVWVWVWVYVWVWVCVHVGVPSFGLRAACGSFAGPRSRYSFAAFVLQEALASASARDVQHG